MIEVRSCLTDEEKEVMAEENIKLVYYFVNKLTTLPYSYDEKVSAGMLGLTKALNEFDPSKGFKFSTFAGLVITNAILKIRQTEKKHEKNISIETPVYGSDSMTLLDAISDRTSESFDWEGINIAVYEVFKTLRDKEKTVYRLFIQNKTQSEIGAVVGVSQAQVNRILKKVLTRIKEEYWKNE